MASRSRTWTRTSVRSATSSRSATVTSRTSTSIHWTTSTARVAPRSASPSTSRPPGRTACTSTSATAAPSARRPSSRPPRRRRTSMDRRRSSTRSTAMTETGTGQDLVAVDLAIGGMTCASCAARIERRLNKLDGVSASVNYATERAKVKAPAGVDIETLVAQVEAAGYTARDARAKPAAATPSPLADAADDSAAEVRRLRDRVIVSAILSAPVIVLAMVPALQFDYWQWLSLTLAAAVVTWGAWPFHRAAWANLRHATATMDTLISLGVLAAFGWSLYALFLGDAGVPGMTHGFTFRAERGEGASMLYLEVGAKDVAVLRSGTEERIPIDQLVVGDLFVVRPGEKVATDGVVTEGTS